MCFTRVSEDSWTRHQRKQKDLLSLQCIACDITMGCSVCSRGEEDEEIIRELPAEGPLVRKQQPLMKYIVAVTTGDKLNAGTDASVQCCLFGEQGDTGMRPLRKSRTNNNKFERKNVSEVGSCTHGDL